MSETKPNELRDLVSAKNHMTDLLRDMNFRRYVKENRPPNAPESIMMMDHVAGCLVSLCQVLAGEQKAGRFVTALSKGDIRDAIRAADPMNQVFIKVYVDFLDHHVPEMLIK